MEKIVFVYNADSGFGNAILDTVHKLTSPGTYKCNLCSISHGFLGMKKEWKEFVEKISLNTEFLHKDEFLKKFSPQKKNFPGVYFVKKDKAELIADLRKLGRDASLKELKNYVWDSLKNNGLV